MSPFILCNIAVLGDFDIARALERIFRSSNSQVLFKIDAFKNFRKFLRKTSVMESLFNKVAA